MASWWTISWALVSGSKETSRLRISATSPPGADEYLSLPQLVPFFGNRDRDEFLQLRCYFAADGLRICRDIVAETQDSTGFFIDPGVNVGPVLIGGDSGQAQQDAIEHPEAGQDVADNVVRAGS